MHLTTSLFLILPQHSSEPFTAVTGVQGLQGRRPTDSAEGRRAHGLGGRVRSCPPRPQAQKPSCRLTGQAQHCPPGPGETPTQYVCVLPDGARAKY